MATKLYTGDDVPDIYRDTKFHCDRIREFWPHICKFAYRVLPTEYSLGYFFGSWQLATPRPLRRFWRLVSWKTLFRARICLLGSRNETLHFDPIFSQNANFRSIFNKTNCGRKWALTLWTSSVNTSKTVSYVFGSWMFVTKDNIMSQHSDISATCCEVISSFVIFAVLVPWLCCYRPYTML